VVLYFSCHGIRDPAGILYFAASTTKANRLAATGISSAFVYDQVERCRSRRIILLLDCCYSGAYLKGHRPRAGDRVTLDPMLGRGWAVITSSTAIEYSYKIDTSDIAGTATPSVFTSALVEGLRTETPTWMRTASSRSTISTATCSTAYANAHPSRHPRRRATSAAT
jgi:uncharacterized caspase-like protein